MKHGHRWFALPVAGLIAAALSVTVPAAEAVTVGTPNLLLGAASGRCLTVEGASTTRGARAIVYDCNSKANQRWTYTSAGELRVYSGTDVKCLDVYRGLTDPGTRVLTWTCHGGANQKWSLNTDGGLTAVQSGLCLDVTGGGSSPNGTPVQIWTCNRHANQIWSQRTPGLPSGVYFQDTGTVQGWNNYPQRPQKQGVIRNVSGPVYKGSTAIEAQQTYVNEGGGYHSETVQFGAQRVGEDRYYGQAIYLAPNWVFHNQNVTFQQWSPEDPSGPCLLMYVQNDEIRFGGSCGVSGVVGKITNLRGTWIRVVTRVKLHSSAGAFEVWANGARLVSRTGIGFLPKTALSVRWSSGIYCTAWRDGTPAGPWTLSIFHDHARIAASYALAEPANW
ncbi:MAG: RICIN domain-containing protein [Micromonosporaceae bacterium]